jgi:hypothetical protein
MLHNYNQNSSQELELNVIHSVLSTRYGHTFMMNSIPLYFNNGENFGVMDIYDFEQFYCNYQEVKLIHIPV